MCNGFSCSFHIVWYGGWCWCDISFYLNSSNWFDCVRVEIKQRFDRRNVSAFFPLCLVDLVPICWSLFVLFVQIVFNPDSSVKRAKRAVEKKGWKVEQGDEDEKWYGKNGRICDSINAKFLCRWSNLLSTQSCQHFVWLELNDTDGAFIFCWLSVCTLCVCDIRLKTQQQQKNPTRTTYKWFIYCETYWKVVPQCGI